MLRVLRLQARTTKEDKVAALIAIAFEAAVLIAEIVAKGATVKLKLDLKAAITFMTNMIDKSMILVRF